MKRHTFLAILLFLGLVFSLVATAPAKKAISYSYTELPYIGESYGVAANLQAFALALNDSGQVVGVDQTGGTPRAFVWSLATNDIQYVEPSPGKTYIIFRSINNLGQAVGDEGAGPDNGSDPILWSPGTDLQTLTEPDGYFNGHGLWINDRGEIVGLSYTSLSPAVGQGVYWDSYQGAPQLIGTLPARTSSIAYGINDRGVVVGASFSTINLDNLPFLWTAQDGLSVLNPPYLPGYGQGLAFRINNRGAAVGWSQAGNSVTAVLWEKGGIKDLGTLTGKSQSRARALNDHGQVVGDSYSLPADPADHRPFLWTKAAGIMDLNDLVPGLPATVTLREARGVNNKGQILVYGFDTSNTGKSVNYVLTPQ